MDDDQKKKPDPNEKASARLSQLEQDVAAKQSARGGAPTHRPGVTAVASMPRGGGSNLTQLEQDIAAKTQPSAAAAPSPHLTQLEQDIAAKVQARGGVSRPMRTSGLSQLEQDIAAKTQAMAPATQPLTQLEQDIAAKTQAAAGVRSAPSFRASSSNNPASLHHLEDDVLAKQNAYSAPPARTAAPPPTSSYASAPSYNNNSGPAAASYASSSYSNSHSAPARASTNHFSTYSNAYENSNNSAYHPSDQMGYNDAPAPALRSADVGRYAPGVSPDEINDPEAPLSYAPPIGDSVDLPAGGIEAFVADHVVDATGVAVILSDEEEEVEVKKRQRKLMIRMALVVAVVLIAVIVPVAVLTGGDVAITPAPTLSPTQSPTLSPTVAELPQLVNSLDLAGISQLSDLQNRQSPQGRAADWIVNDDTYVSEQGLTVSDVAFVQRYVLAVFYFAMTGDAWGVCHRADTSCSATGEVNSWLTPTDVCTWFVVGCNDQGLITSISFQDSSQDDNFNGKITPLKGAMPAEIGQLTSLERLIISSMEVQGILLEYLSNMPNLYYLSVKSNNFTGSITETFAAEHPMLSHVDLSFNQITGVIPSSFGSLQFLSTLTMSNNLLKGNLPSQLANISALQFLDLEHNRMTGEIPKELYSPNFIKLRLTENAWQGTIRSEIALMVNLKDFTVGSSDMSGKIPSELFSVRTLEVLDLHNASFSGPLLEEGFSNLTSMVRWEMEDNDFTGTVPFTTALVMENLERFQMQGNNLTWTEMVPDEFCSARGSTPTTLQIVFVDCDIPCPRGCCDSRLECGNGQ